MNGAAAQALVTVLVGGVAFVWVTRRSGRSELRLPVQTLIGFVVIWIGGKGLMESDAHAVARTGLLISYLGGCCLGPSWLYLAARFTRSELVERMPGLILAACVPPAMAYLALLTNDGHRLWATSLDPVLLRKSAAAWAGPVFWLSMAWQIGLVLFGALLFLRAASRSASPAQRRRSLWISLAATLPVTTALLHYLGLLPFDYDPIPLITGTMVAAILVIAARHRLLDFLPLARRDVIDAISDAVILTDADGQILDLNPAAEKLLEGGRRPMRDRPLARTLAELAGDLERSAAQRNIEEALVSGDASTIALRTRKERDLEIQIGSVRDAEDEPSARFAVVRDVTESRRYERLLRDSQQRVVVGGLAAGLAHEVNNPLAFVASNLHQIRRAVSFTTEELAEHPPKRAEELAELEEVVAETIDGVSRIAEIVGRIIRPGLLSEDDLVPLDLGRVVEEAVRLVAFHGESGVRSQVEIASGLPVVEGCPERLSQALINLLLHAQQTAGGVPDASLAIAVDPDRDGVALRLDLRDGRGERFTGSLPGQGAAEAPAGAEISAAYETVREHGGTLESGDEPGVLFRLRLPAAAAA